jgi:integrase
VSIHRYETGDGTRWRVRWRDPGGKLRSATVLSKGEARTLDLDIKAKKLRSEVHQAFDHWVETHKADKAAATLDSYRVHWDAHMRRQLGAEKLGHLVAEPELIENHLTKLADAGLGPSSRRKVLMIASGVFSHQLRLNKVARNPIQGMPKPSAKRARTPRPFSPILIERIRAHILGRQPTTQALRDACLVTLLSYVGLRPQEAIALTFADVHDQTVDITKAIRKAGQGCEIGPTKTGEARYPPLAAAARDDVTELHAALGKPPSGASVFALISGAPWTISAYGAWASRSWRPALKALAESDPELPWLTSARPYDCRGSFVSLQLRGGVPPLEVAHNSGHSSQVMFKHYAGVIKELVGEPQLEPDEQIRRARLLLAEQPLEEVRAITAESLKPPREAKRHARNLLYGARQPIHRPKRPAS